MFKNFMRFSKFSNIGKLNILNKPTSSFGLKTITNAGSKSKNVGYFLLGAGTIGLGLLSYNLHNQSAQYTKSLLFSPSVSNHISTQRIKDTMLYFSGGLILTAGVGSAMLRNPRFLMYSTSLWSLLFTLPASFFFMYKLRTTDQSNVIAKHLYMVGFNSVMAFNLLPILAFTELVILRDALLLTSGCFAGLGYTAYMSRNDAFLGMSGMLGAGLGGLIAISIGNIFFNNPILFNLWLYGGMALFLGLSLYDLKTIQLRANKAYHFDPMSESVGIYMDFINIFIRMTMILQNRKK